VYGMTCLIALVAFAQRHDKHVVKHRIIPGFGAFMNLAMLFGVVYLAITAGGAGSKDAYKALGIVGLWIVIGIIWVAINPNKGSAKEVHVGRGTPKVVVPPAEVVV
jgi:APA family basic amino acid/polyamine antiporter